MSAKGRGQETFTSQQKLRKEPKILSERGWPNDRRKFSWGAGKKGEKAKKKKSKEE